MTIRPGEAWGARVPVPDGLTVVADDAALARHLAATDADLQPVLVTGGDLRRTLGGPARAGAWPDTVNALPVDLVEVVLDGGAVRTACAHVVIRTPWWRGGWLRGPVVLVMNAEFIGDWDVAPRGHPNDGRIEVVEAGGDLGIRQRLAAWRRLPSAAHLPHPRITTRSVRTARWDFGAPMAVRIDGVATGTARSVEVTVVPDAAVVHA